MMLQQMQMSGATSA